MYAPKIKALLGQIESGKMNTDAAKILNFIQQRGEANAVHMISLLNIQKTTLYARLSGLEDLGLVYKSGTFNDGKDSLYKYEPDPKAQANNRLKRELIKFELWKKRGLTEFSDYLTAGVIVELKSIDNV